jgi:hypothetical protein
MLAIGVAFLGVILAIGGEEWSPHPILGAVVISIAVGLIAAVVVRGRLTSSKPMPNEES